MSRIVRRAWTMLAVVTLRAVRRMGKLLERFQQPPQQRLPNDRDQDQGAHGQGNGQPSSQKEAARQAGISRHQEEQARRVAKVPEQEFEGAVESDLDVTLRRFRRAVVALWAVNALLAVSILAAVVAAV